MRRRKFCGELFLPRLWPSPVNELEKIKSNSDAVGSDQIRDVLDVIDVPIQDAFVRSGAHEDGIYTDHSASLTDYPNLFITNVALDVVIVAGVRMGDDRRLGGE